MLATVASLGIPRWCIQSIAGLLYCDNVLWKADISSVKTESWAESAAFIYCILNQMYLSSLCISLIGAHGKSYESMNALPVYFRRHCAIFMYLTEVSWSSAGITTIIQPTTFACFKGLDVAFDTLHLACSAAGIGIHALSAPLQSTHRPDSSLYRWKCHRNYLDYISISLSNLRHRYPSLLEILIVFWVQLSDLASPLESRS